MQEIQYQEEGEKKMKPNTSNDGEHKNSINKIKGCLMSVNPNWKTPEWLYQELNKEFKFDFDPCPVNPNFDGLNVEWGNRNYVNPPYKDNKLWLKKGFEEWKKGKTCVFLIPSRTDSRYWHDFVMNANEIRFIKGRLKFQGAKHSSPFPSCIVVFNGEIAKLAQESKS